MVKFGLFEYFCSGFTSFKTVLKHCLKVGSGKKEGGLKVYSIDGHHCGTVALDIFFLCIQPHLSVYKFPFLVIPAQSVGPLMQKVGMAVKTVLSPVSYSLWRR